eukprot:gene7172-12838_t
MDLKCGILDPFRFQHCDPDFLKLIDTVTERGGLAADYGLVLSLLQPSIRRHTHCVYIESQRPDVPYFICSIRDIRKSKRDHVFVNVTWFYRPCEVPLSVYQLLIHDRNNENGSDHVLEDPAVKERELFISDSVDTYPILALRGHINILPFSEVKQRLKEYTEEEDNWFYILRYNPESRRLANTKGEIRVGSNHQVKLPRCVPLKQRAQKGMVRKCPEQLVWAPQIEDSDLMMFLRASRSIFSFSGYVDDDGSIDRALNVISEESTTVHCLNMLHKNKYDVSRALQALIRSPFAKTNARKWSEDERKLFVRGLRQYGKNFNKIKRELLSDRKTSELVHYYYVWKKTPTAINSRPHKRGRRHSVLCRKTRSTKNKTTPASEFLDLSSCSEDEPDSEDSERDLSLYACRHCYNTKSPNWHHVGKEKLLVCKECREYFKKYGRMRPIECRTEPPSYIFKAAFENHNDNLSNSGRMRTRRSATPIFTANGSVRTKILHEIQEARLTRLKKADSPSTNSSDSSSSFKENSSTELVRKRNQDSESDGADEIEEADVVDEEIQNEESEAEDEIEAKRGRFEDDADKCEDEEEEEEDEYDETESPGDLETTSSEAMEQMETNLDSMIEEGQANQQVAQDKEEGPDDDSTKKEEVSMEEEVASEEELPDVLDDPRLVEKITKSFKRTSDDDKNACARCGLVYVVKRPKKEKQGSKSTISSSSSSSKSREPDLKANSSPPPNPSAPAHITSHFQNAIRNYWPSGEDPRSNPNFSPFWPPHFNQFVSFPHEMSGGHMRSHSPVEQNVDYHPKFGHLLDVFSKHGAPIGGHSNFPGHSSFNGHGGHTGHSIHPGQHGPPPAGHNRPMSAQSHPHPDVPVPGQTALPVFPSHNSRPTNPPNIDNISRVSPRPHIDPPGGLPYGYGHPHLHSHLHTHTHLHLHPSDNAERHNVPREHQPATSNAHPVLGHPPSLGLSHETSLLRPEELLHHIQQDPRMRNALLGPGGVPTREGAISPAMLHEYFRHDPTAYHLWLSQVARSHQEHLFPDPLAHQNLRLLAEHEEYLRHMRSLAIDPKMKAEHDRVMSLPERGLPVNERTLPRGEQFPFTPAAYIEHIRRLHGRITPPHTPLSVKPVTIDLCED